MYFKSSFYFAYLFKMSRGSFDLLRFSCKNTSLRRNNQQSPSLANLYNSKICISYEQKFASQSLCTYRHSRCAASDRSVLQTDASSSSGEIFKENLTDLFYTNFEQMAFSLFVETSKPFSQQDTSGVTDRSLLLADASRVNRRFASRGGLANLRFARDRSEHNVRHQRLCTIGTKPLVNALPCSVGASRAPTCSYLQIEDLYAGQVGASQEDTHDALDALCKARVLKTHTQKFNKKQKKFKNTPISLNIKIGDYLSSGDKIGEKNRDSGLDSMPKKGAFSIASVRRINQSLLCKTRPTIVNRNQIALSFTSIKSTKGQRFLRMRSVRRNALPLHRLALPRLACPYLLRRSTATTCPIGARLTSTNQRFVRRFVCTTFNTNCCFSKPYGARQVGACKSKICTPKVKKGHCKHLQIGCARHAPIYNKLKICTLNTPNCPYLPCSVGFAKATIGFECPGGANEAKLRANRGTARQGIHRKAIPIILTSSGRVVMISKTQLIVQKTQPILFYDSANLHVRKGELVSQGAPILTLTHQTLITGDIVQGIPRIEQLFEAFTSPQKGLKDRKRVNAHDTLHSQVRDIFRKNWLQNVLSIAVRKSLEEIQSILLEMIQKVYLSQGVLISDKHIEIIIRQMTSKGQILDSGSTGLLLEEVLPIRQIENANITTPGKKCLYVPSVVGLTAASLTCDSFVSAASFQETTRVLSRDAVVGKSDFLRGLKEKVVIGDLISAGTGLEIYFIYTLFSQSI